MEDYPKDPMGYEPSTVTPANQENGKVKEELTVEPALLDIKEEVKKEQDDEEVSMPPPVTPEKRGKRAQSKASNGEETPSKKAKTTPGSKSTPVKSNPIPATFEEAGPEDRMILHMRDNEGRSWADITTAWASMTGCSPAKNSLRVRYGRMKNNFVTFDSDHVPALLEAKKEIESQFESEKWQKISTALEAKCGEKYSSSVVMKKFKELSKKSAGSPIVIKDED